MSGTTDNFGLTWLKLGDPWSTNGDAFLTSNIKRIDSLLALGRDHNHTAAAASITDPDTAPSLVVGTTYGNIPAGTTVRYKYTYIDEFGNESAASPEATVTTAAVIERPGGLSLFSTSTTGGTLLVGQYFYVASAYVDANTAETRASGTRTPVSITFLTSTNQITLTLPSLPANATGFNIYRRAPNESNYSYLDSVNMNVATPPTDWTDDGSLTPNRDRHLPTTNNTSSVNNVTVSLPGATPAVPANATWKLYRTYVSGDYNGSFLYHITEETSPGSGIIEPTYNDTGTATTSGTPPLTSYIIAQPSKIDFTDAAEVQGQLPPGMNVVPYEVYFRYAGTLSTSTGAIVWRCPFDNAKIQSVACTLGIGASPNSTDVIVDVNYYDSQAATPAWSTIYTTQANRPKVTVGNQIGTATVPDIVDLVEGDMLTFDIDQVGGGTNTDSDLLVTIYMFIASGSSTTTLSL
jgi:hypothetical protein